MENKRRTLIVDKPFQLQLVMEAVLITFVAINVIVIATFLMLFSGSVLPASTMLFIGITVASVEVIALTVIFWVARKSSNRIAGPVYRFCRTIEAIGEGDLSGTIQLRRKDYFAEQADVYNHSVTKLRDRIESARKLAKMQLDNPDPEIARRLYDELSEFRTRPEPVRPAEGDRGHSKNGDRVVSRPEGQGGFTLIELMLGLLVLSILSVIALPLYLDYVVRTQVTEGFVLADPVKRTLTEIHLETGSFPADHNASGLPPPGDYKTNYVKAIEVQSNGFIEIVFDIPALGDNNLLYLEPRSNVEGAFGWNCDDDRPGTLQRRYRPNVCRGS